jgi:hypothetical protein
MLNFDLNPHDIIKLYLFYVKKFKQNIFKYHYKDTFNTSKSKYQNNSSNFDCYDLEDEFNNNQLDDPEIDENNDFITGPLAITNNQHSRILDSNDYKFEDQDPAMVDSFFKRVDSLNLIKPKKAKIVRNYLIGELLGDGSYGKVKECLDLNDLSRRAVKIINLKLVSRKIPHGVENVRKEIKIMRKLDHKNIIKLYNTFEKGSETGNTKNENNYQDEFLNKIASIVVADKPPKLYIFMDYCIISMEKLLKNAPDQRLHNYQASFYFKQLIDGIGYLHALNIIHNDIKPGNLLITCNDILKICDFSISVELDRFCYYEYLLQSKSLSKENEQEIYYDEINSNLLSYNNNNMGKCFF